MFMCVTYTLCCSPAQPEVEDKKAHTSYVWMCTGASVCAYPCVSVSRRESERERKRKRNLRYSSNILKHTHIIQVPFWQPSASGSRQNTCLSSHPRAADISWPHNCRTRAILNRFSSDKALWLLPRATPRGCGPPSVWQVLCVMYRRYIYICKCISTLK